MLMPRPTIATSRPVILENGGFITTTVGCPSLGIRSCILLLGTRGFWRIDYISISHFIASGDMGLVRL